MSKPIRTPSDELELFATDYILIFNEMLITSSYHAGG